MIFKFLASFFKGDPPLEPLPSTGSIGKAFDKLAVKVLLTMGAFNPSQEMEAVRLKDFIFFCSLIPSDTIDIEDFVRIMPILRSLELSLFVWYAEGTAHITKGNPLTDAYFDPEKWVDESKDFKITETYYDELAANELYHTGQRAKGFKLENSPSDYDEILKKMILR